VHLGWTIRRSAYFDSIALMRIAEQARHVAGVTESALVMGTPANRTLLAEAGLWPPDAPDVGPSDVVVVVRAQTVEAVRLALHRVEDLMDARRESVRVEDVPPATMFGAARCAGEADLALVAVPGLYAALEAQQALSAGLHVFLFSDGVSLDEEVALKRRARARGLLVMGPECGTAIVNGVGLGFANRVRRGAVGVVGASGTGIQEITILVHRLGGGIAHAIGTGGRDLHAAIGGVTTLQALDRLAADDGTRVIVLVSKPPSRAVADVVLAAAVQTRKPVVACLLGYAGAMPDGVVAAATLEEAARAALALVGGPAPDLERPRAVARRRPRGSIRGLYSGGTLCEEARRLVAGGEHRFVDFGAEQYTRGRPHPIVDPRYRDAAILEAAADPSVSVILLDLVLGDCAHPDPAVALDPILVEAHDRARGGGRELALVAHVVGTDEDPQDLVRQQDVLRKRGAIVCPSNRMAALTAQRLAEGDDVA